MLLFSIGTTAMVWVSRGTWLTSELPEDQGSHTGDQDCSTMPRRRRKGHLGVPPGELGFPPPSPPLCEAGE